jgi:hypothetical protein
VDPAIGDDRRDEARGRDIERRGVRFHFGGRDVTPRKRAQFVRGPLLDLYVRTGGSCWIERRSRRSDVERATVITGQNCERVGADLVRDIPVGGDAIRADEAEVDAPGRHETPCHAVGKDCDVDTRPCQLPRREPTSLE